MKVQSVCLKNFKCFRDKLLDFTDPETGKAKDMILLMGMNGSGKTSILQAIAAVLGNATGRLEKISDLDWPGFDSDLVGANSRIPTTIEIQTEFSDDEINATQKFCQLLKEQDKSFIIPSNKSVITLKMKENKVFADSPYELFQCKGWEYAKQLCKFHNEGYKIFEQIGTVFWYTEQRTSTSLTSEDNSKKIEITDNLLRDRLSKFAFFHQQLESGKFQKLRQGKKDLFSELQKAYGEVFPGRSFIGPVPRNDIDGIMSELWFYLYDGQYEYEISEMSGGERAIFPILFDFVNWNIHNSVILIDEIELHLHPPLQQGFIRALKKLGKNNQFIITAHSDHIAHIVPNDSIIWIEE